MAVTSSARLAITRWSDAADPYTRAQRDADNAILDDLVAIDVQGTAADRPAAAIRGRNYFETDTGRQWRDDGAAWHEAMVYRHTITGSGELACIGDDAHAAADAGPVIGVSTTKTARLMVSGNSSLPSLALLGGAALPGPVSASDIASHTNDAGDLTVRLFSDGALAAGRPTVGDIVSRDAFHTLRPGTTGERGLLVDHMPAATGDLLRASTDGTRRFTVDAKGRIFLSALSDNAAPATPGGAGAIYCNTVGDLLYKAPSGVVTTLAHH